MNAGKKTSIVKRYQVRWATDGGSGLLGAAGSAKIYTRKIAMRIVRGLKKHGREAWISPLMVRTPQAAQQGASEPGTLTPT